MPEIDRIVDIGALIAYSGILGIAWNTLIDNLAIFSDAKEVIQKKHRLISLINQTHTPLSQEFKLTLPHLDTDDILEHLSTTHLSNIHGALTFLSCREHGIDGPLYNVGCLNVEQEKISKEDKIEFINTEGQNILSTGDNIDCVHFIPFGSVKRRKEFVGETLLLGAVDLLRYVNQINHKSPGQKPKYVYGFTSEEFGKTLQMFGAQPITILEEESPKRKENGGFYFDVEKLIQNKSKLQRYLQRWKTRAQKTGLDERRARITAINYLL